MSYIAKTFGSGQVMVSSDEHADLPAGHVRDHLLLTREEAQGLRDSLDEALKVNGVRLLAGGLLEHHGNQVVEPDAERLRALLRARAEETGYEVASVDVGGTPAAPRFVLCWPTGNELAFSNLVAEVFGDTIAAVARMNRERGPGVDRIAAERQRQVVGEGYAPEHDARHVHGELARAAAVYACPAVYAEHVFPLWPRGWVRPSYIGGDDADRVRELVKAGALIAAEIDRLLRAGATT